MSFTLAPDVKTARATVLLTALDAAATPPTVRLYTGPQPVAGAAITTETLLAESLLSDPCGSVTGPTLTLTLPPPALVLADGTAAWGRIEDGDGNWRLDGDVGLGGSGAFFEVDAVTVYAGGLLSWTQATLTEA
jgi:hypothetical protein